MSKTTGSRLAGLLAGAAAALLLIGPAAQAKGPAGAYDRAFMTEMVGHHTMAVDMGKMAEMKSTHPQLKATARAIVRSQRAEIRRMQSWLKRWYGKSARPMMSHEEMAQMAELERATGAAFEIRFMALMTEHHTLAIERANAALRRARHADIRKLAKGIVRAQKREVRDFRNWLVAWYAK